MSDSPFQNTTDALKQNLEEMNNINNNQDLDKREKKMQLRKMLKSLSDGVWTVVEDVMIDVEVAARTEILLEKRNKVPTSSELLKLTEIALTERYESEEDVLKVLISTLPNSASVRKWLKKPEWKDEVEKRMRDETLFSSSKRAKMINSLYLSGSTGNTRAAEIWLKMSGDLNKDPNKDPVANMFEKIQNSLTKKK